MEGKTAISVFDATDALTVELQSRLPGIFKSDNMTRALYATDASNYRHVPIGVVQPRSVDEVVEALSICRTFDVPVTARGAATSTSGQACNEAVIFDFARYPHGQSEIDEARRLATVAPGTVLDALNAQARAFGLQFGPDPSTHSRCTLGGMIGNNSCGSHSITYGKTADNIEELDLLLYDGTRLSVGATSDAKLEELCGRSDRVGELYRDLQAIRDTYGDAIRAHFPVLPRRVSGYNLEQLLPENGFHVARALVGTEGSCAFTLGAQIQLVDLAKATCLTVLGFSDIFAAANAVPALLAMRPHAIEGMDLHLVNAYSSHNRGEAVRALLPEGQAWLLVETGGATKEIALYDAQVIIDALQAEISGAAIVSDAVAARSVWRIREDGAGIATRHADGSEAWPGWEDPAVPPENLGQYLRDFEELLKAENLSAITYGHFGDGCVHSRINFDFRTGDGIARFRRFVESAAGIVVRHHGSLSGEHGDGQARGELIAKMYPPQILEAFAAFKAAFDPSDRMNPGGIVRPRHIDANLRIHSAPTRVHIAPNLALRADNGDIGASTRRCVGVGRCVSAKGGVMCPSFRATREEKDSPRGRSHLLFEMLSGELVADGWRSAEVREALDLCLGCKGCKSDCPVNVDIATYKSEFFSHYYRRRLRPISHYSMGRLPTWLRVGAKAAGLVNAIAASPLSKPLQRMAGIAPERVLPKLATQTFQKQFARFGANGVVDSKPRVVIWPDTFTNYFEPQIANDAVSVLQSLGFAVEVPGEAVCCGLTYLSTGQVDKARKNLEHTIQVLEPWLSKDIPIIGLEPSCTALLRADASELLPKSTTAGFLSNQVRTFAEFLTDQGPDLALPKMTGTALAQVHCHQHADLGFDPDRQVISAMGIALQVLDEGCCGLAGNFGFEKEHYDLSIKCAESGLVPVLEKAASDASILADGFSCRTQVRHLSNREPVHLATLVARAIRSR